ncbi:MAG: WD40/YVTN/BNR-like repeat-containing protein, partial [Thermoanaerobaculia bacterium]
GASWEPLRAGPAFPGYVATGLVADPMVPGRLYASLAGQYGGGLVVLSDDRGARWTILARFRDTVATRALAVVPGEPARLAIGGDDGVRLSRDGGATWARTGADTPGLVQVESLAFDPSDPTILYAGTWRQAFRTQDGGAAWTRIAEGMVLDATVYSWDFDSGNPRDIWVSTCGWVYRSKDGGDRWTRYKAGFTNRRSHAVRRDPTRPGFVYAATVGGLHRSTDDGETWERLSRESLVVTALEVDARTGRLYVGTEGEGAFFSDDGGRTLVRGSAGLAEGRVSDIVSDPGDPSRVFFFRAYAGEEGGVWEAQGRRVRRVSLDPLPASASLAAFGGEAAPTLLVLSSSAGVRVSRDGGEHWAAPESPPAGTPIALFGAPFSAPLVVTTSGVFRASADGREFAALPGAPAAPEAAELLIDQRGAPLLEVKSGAMLYRWSGEHWSLRRQTMLKRGVFLEESAGATASAWSTLQEVGGKLVWEDGGRRLAVTSPRAGLALASAAATFAGRLYVGTTGDGLFLFEP